MISFSIILIFFISFNEFLKKKNFLLDNINSQVHKSFSTKKSTPLTGGIFLILFLFVFMNEEYFYFQIFLLLIFLNGLVSDIDYIDNPNIRFSIQSVIVLFFIYFLDLRIYGVGLDYIDFYLSNNRYINYFFTLFCLLILINGFNFIDGLNTLSLGYFLIVLLSLIFVENRFNYDFKLLNNYYSILFLILLYLLIFKGYLYLGDSGSYLLGLFLGVKIIYISRNFPEISAWYFALLLWYPAFEILFSIIRKNFSKKSPFKPDNKHLHQKIFSKLKYKIPNKLANPISANLINIYNFISIVFGSLNIYDTKKIILIIFINIFFYIIIFHKLKD